MKCRARVVVFGRVQGVSFRAWTAQVARSLGLVGYVRNLPDGGVAIIAEGDEAAVEQMIELAWQGPPLARVDAVEVLWSEPTGEFSGFDIRP